MVTSWRETDTLTDHDEDSRVGYWRTVGTRVNESLILRRERSRYPRPQPRNMLAQTTNLIRMTLWAVGKRKDRF